MVLQLVMGAALTFVPLGGLMPFELAEQLRDRLAREEPGAVFVIQEVGSA